MEIKGDTLLSYVQKAKETLSPEQAIQEQIDDAHDANAKNIWINYDSKKRRMVIKDDGHGFKKEDLEKFFTNIRTPIATEYDPEFKIGGGGWGGFDSLCKLANYEDSKEGVASVSRTTLQGDVKHNATWYLSESEQLLSEVNMKYDMPMAEEEKGKTGVITVITQCYPYTKRQWNAVKEGLSKIYAHVLGDFKIHINDGNFGVNSKPSQYTEIKPKDPMYIDLLGEDINNEGVHLAKNGFIFEVKNFAGKHKNDEISFKVVNLFIPNKLNPKGSTSQDGGVYAIKARKRYINTGDNYSQMWGVSGQAHAVSQRRMAIYVDDKKQSDFFGIGGNKGAGIVSLFQNPKLRSYKTDEGISLFDALKQFYGKSNKLYMELNATIKNIGWKDKKTFDLDEYMVILRNLTNVHKMRTETIVKKITEIKKRNRKPSSNQKFRDHISEIQKLNDGFVWNDDAMKEMYSQQHDSLNCKLYDDGSIQIVKNQWCPDFVVIDEYQRLAEYLLSSGKKPWRIMEFLNGKIKYENNKLNAYKEAI